jgi:GNAT superfamily N-acetyltransferase
VRKPRPIEAQQKQEATMLARYGVKHAWESPEIFAKATQTVKERYGVENISLHPEVRQVKQNWWYNAHRSEPIAVPEGVLVEETKAQFGYDVTKRMATSSRPVVCRCAECGSTFVRSRNLLAAPLHCSRCTYRHGAYAISRAELTLVELIYSWLKETPVQQKRVGDRKSLDIYIESRKVAIEYCGLYWHREREHKGKTYYTQWRHHTKLQLCAQQGMRLITIFEDEWLHRKSQVINFLQSVLGVYEKKVGARICNVVRVTTLDAQRFMADYHIQGAGPKPLASFGLQYQDELVGVLILNRHHRQGQEGCVVLGRLCFKSGYQVVGGASRLLSAAKAWAQRQQCYTKMVSWSDSRWSQGRVYEQMGFRLDAELPPDYSYVRVSAVGVRYSKQSQRKKATQCPPELTEKAWAEQRGLARIWDCGHKRWVLDL